MLEKIFGIKKSGSTVSREILGGLTTFLTMAYIIFVNPIFLTAAGIPKEGAILATCLASAITIFLMAFWANYPIALAPGMGLNAFFAYSICLGAGVPWQTALGLVFWSGVVFFIAAVTKLESIINAVPNSLKLAAGAGIGLFIAFIGLQHSGIVTRHTATMVGIGDLGLLPARLTLLGLLITIILMCLRIRIAIFLGLVITAIISIVSGATKPPTEFFELPKFDLPGFQIDLLGALQVRLLDLMIVLIFFDIFDTAGTLMGVGYEGGFLKDGKLPRANRAFASDAVGTMVGAFCGTSTVTSYIESATGIGVGARTGFANIITGGLFIIALFTIPLIAVFGRSIEITGVAYYPITAPALILVGVLMTGGLGEIAWKDITEAIPAFLTIIIMPLTFNVTHGLAAGIVSYTITKIASGRMKEVPLLIYIIAVLFILRYIFLP